jgi:hypothetical protein
MIFVTCACCGIPIAMILVERMIVLDEEGQSIETKLVCPSCAIEIDEAMIRLMEHMEES